MGEMLNRDSRTLSFLSLRRLTCFALIIVLFSIATLKPSSAQAPKPDGPLAIILIRDALSALNHANWTGNYTVLRDYASPNFARVNDPVRLTAIFQPIRAQGLNLAPTLFLVPKITKAELTQQGKRLQLKGFFESRPKQIQFDLIFEPIANRWRLFGIGVWALESNKAELPKIDAEVPAASNKEVGNGNSRANNQVTVPKQRPNASP